MIDGKAAQVRRRRYGASKQPSPSRILRSRKISVREIHIEVT